MRTSFGETKRRQSATVRLTQTTRTTFHLLAWLERTGSR